MERVTMSSARRARSASRVRRATSLRMAQFTPNTAKARRPAPTTEKASHAQVRGSTPCGATSTRTHSSRIRCTSSAGTSRSAASSRRCTWGRSAREANASS